MRLHAFFTKHLKNELNWVRKINSIKMPYYSLRPSGIVVKTRGNVTAGIPVSQFKKTLYANLIFTKIEGGGIINYPEKKKY